MQSAGIISLINLARSAFPRLRSWLWSRREISLRTKSRVYQIVVRSIVLYGCQTWTVRVADERMLTVFDNESIHRIQHAKRRDWVPKVELRRRLCLASTPALLVQRRLRWFGHAARRPEVELTKGLLLPKPPRTWCRRTRGKLTTWATTIKADLQPLPGPRVSSKLAQHRRAWSVSGRDVINSIGDAGSTRLNWMPPQVQVAGSFSPVRNASAPLV